VQFSGKPQKLSLFYECKHETKNKKSFIEKSKELQKSLSVTQNHVQFSLKVVL